MEQVLFKISFHVRYISLFDKPFEDDSLDGSLDMDNEPRRSRQNSFSMDNAHTVFVSTSFTARHNRLLTEFLTHTHLPGKRLIFCRFFTDFLVDNKSFKIKK